MIKFIRNLAKKLAENGEYRAAYITIENGCATARFKTIPEISRERGIPETTLKTRAKSRKIGWRPTVGVLLFDAEQEKELIKKS